MEVRRNVSALVDAPKGQPGRRSKSLTLDQAAALVDKLPKLAARKGLPPIVRTA